MKIYTFLLLSLIFLQCSNLKESADLIILNGTVYSATEQKNIEAIAIKSGRILKVGTNQEVSLLNNDDTKVIDAEGKL